MYNLVTWVKPFGDKDTGYKDELIKLIKNDTIFCDNMLEIRQPFENEYLKYLPVTLNTICYGVSGSEAIEHALLIAEYLTGKKKFLYFTGCYHGSSICLLNVSYSTEKKEPFYYEFSEIDPPYCYRCNKGYCNNYSCLDETFRNISDDNDFAGIIVDPSFGNILLDMDRNYFKELKSLCQKNNLLLIFDEIRSGMARMGSLFAFEKYDIVPDILCISKAIACGLPLSLTIYNGRDLSISVKQKLHYKMETTFAGMELSLKMAKYTIQRISQETNLLQEKAEYFKKRLRELLKYDVIGDIRSTGMIFAIEFVNPKNNEYSTLIALKFVNNVRKYDVLINSPAYGSILLLHPFLTITTEEIDEVVEIFERCLK